MVGTCRMLYPARLTVSSTVDLAYVTRQLTLQVMHNTLLMILSYQAGSNVAPGLLEKVITHYKY